MSSDLESCDWSSELESESFSSCSWSDIDESDSQGPHCEWSDSTPKNDSDTEPSISPPVRKSPRKPCRKNVYDPSALVKDLTGWQLTKVLELNGCAPRCAQEIHGLTPYDILQSHSIFWSQRSEQQKKWLLDYFLYHCPNTSDAPKDVKSIQFLICGRIVCQSIWQATLGLSNTRFYGIRKEFLSGVVMLENKRPRNKSRKSFETIAWMEEYFERIGDKRPDKHGIYLPTCLTERSIYSTMIEELHAGDTNAAVCFSQFNKLFRENFRNVTIPRVSLSLYLI